MAIPDHLGNNTPQVTETEQYAVSKTFDQKYQIMMVGLGAYNPNTNSYDRVQINNSGQLVTSSTGGGGSGDIYNETPSGAINGTNKNFTTANNYRVATLRPFLNGQRLAPTNDYLETGANSFQLVNPPFPGDILIVDYAKQ